MLKKFIVCDLIAGIAILLELIMLTLGMEKMGAVAYILLDAIGGAVILFIVNFVANKFGKIGNTKTCIINAVVIVLLYVLISGVYGKTPLGTQAEKNLDKISISEGEVFSEEVDRGIELTLSDGSELGQILNYGFYLFAAFAGGQIGIRMKKRTGRTGRTDTMAESVQ